MQNRLMVRFLLFSLTISVSCFTQVALSTEAQPVPEQRQRFIIGAENIDYFPHHNFNNSTDKGYAWSLLEAFAASKNYQFIYHALPIKRLRRELDKGTIDFVYPDNPKWFDAETPDKKSYSRPLSIAVGGTMVRRDWRDNALAEFETLAVPLGFTPVKWLSLISAGDVNLIQVPDSSAALQVVLLGRATGADIEYNVAQHLMIMMNRPGELVLNTQLPLDEVGFAVSTHRHPQVIAELDQFIADNTALITRLKQRYALVSPQEAIAENAP